MMIIFSGWDQNDDFFLKKKVLNLYFAKFETKIILTLLYNVNITNIQYKCGKTIQAKLKNILNMLKVFCLRGLC